MIPPYDEPAALAELAGDLYDMAEELTADNDRAERRDSIYARYGEYAEEAMLDDRERARDMAKELRQW